MARLAVGKASSPSAACRALNNKRSNGRSAAYKRCLKAAKRLQKNQLAAEAREQREAEEADAVSVSATLDGLLPGLLPDLPNLDDEPVEEPDEGSDEDIDEDI